MANKESLMRQGLWDYERDQPYQRSGATQRGSGNQQDEIERLTVQRNELVVRLEELRGEIARLLRQPA